MADGDLSAKGVDDGAMLVRDRNREKFLWVVFFLPGLLHGAVELRVGKAVQAALQKEQAHTCGTPAGFPKEEPLEHGFDNKGARADVCVAHS
ncbi:hypothetical protein [Candidatus Korobacter versatilis]|uniref:hypothetical protein n=1 Tax=Candidatus Korobacter versatilis TaxID=658062 RepID=UPI0038CBF9A2